MVHTFVRQKWKNKRDDVLWNHPAELDVPPPVADHLVQHVFPGQPHRSFPALFANLIIKKLQYFR